MDAKNRIHSSVAALNIVSNGGQLATGQRMIDETRLAADNLQYALSGLAECRNLIEQLETKEWVDDD